MAASHILENHVAEAFSLVQIGRVKQRATTNQQSGIFYATADIVSLIGKIVFEKKCGCALIFWTAFLDSSITETSCGLVDVSRDCRHLVIELLQNKIHDVYATLETRIHLLQPKSVNLLFQVCRNFLKKEHLKPLSTNIIFSLKENQKAINKIILGSECEEYLNELTIKGHVNIVSTVRENCLTFYITAAEEICKRLPINDTFLSKLQVFGQYESLYNNNNRETLFNDISFVIKTIDKNDDFDENALKQEWMTLPSDFTIAEKQRLSKLNFDNMWKEILQRRHTNNIIKYPNLTNVLNIIRSLPNSNADSERMFSLLSNIKMKKRNKFSSASVNAICVFKSALKTRGETAINMTIDENHLSLMSSDKLYATATKQNKNILLHTADNTDIAGSSSNK
ncbi:uncharacterized protein LOC105259571 [Camponotus floridanus]|nr:uncharacterized protein LOC105259571 [Camponotus floridanus]